MDYKRVETFYYVLEPFPLLWGCPLSTVEQSKVKFVNTFFTKTLMLMRVESTLDGVKYIMTFFLSHLSWRYTRLYLRTVVEYSSRPGSPVLLPGI